MQCDYKDCTTSFYVRCAINEGLIKEWDEMHEHMVDDKTWEAFIFCKKHKQAGIKALAEFGVAGIKGKLPTKVKDNKNRRIAKEIMKRRKNQDQTHVVQSSSDNDDDEEDLGGIQESQLMQEDDEEMLTVG